GAGSGVASDDDELGAGAGQVAAHGERPLAYLGVRAITVGAIRGVGDVEHVLGGKGAPDLARHAEAADAGIEERDQPHPRRSYRPGAGSRMTSAGAGIVLPVTDRPSPAASMPGTPWLLYLGLGVVVWGLFVPDQGLWHDDVQNLFRAFVAPERGEGLFPAIAAPTRRLLGLPFIAALATGWPVQALHLLSAAAWITTAVLADRLARRLWPATPLAALLAAALTACATPDLSTDAALAVGYQQSVVLYMSAVLLGLGWLQSGSRAALWAAPVALGASLWTTDAAVAAWPVTPLLWAAAPGARGRRALPLGLLWFLAPVPYLITLAGLV